MAIDRCERPRLRGNSLEPKRVRKNTGRDRIDLPFAADADDFGRRSPRGGLFIAQLVQKRVHPRRKAQAVRGARVPEVVFAGAAQHVDTNVIVEFAQGRRFDLPLASSIASSASLAISRW